MTLMVSTDRLLAFAAMSFLLIIVPGPSVLFVIGRALAQGRRAGVAATAREWFARSPQRLSLVGGVGGLAMIGLGVTVASTGRKD